MTGLKAVRVRGKGRGVLAGGRFSRGDTVNSAPVVVIPARQWKAISETTLSEFCFHWDEATGSMAIALGLGSLFNHSYQPNVAAAKTLRARVIEFVALRDIEAGEELTINYHGEPGCRDPVGFDVKDQ